MRTKVDQTRVLRPSAAFLATIVAAALVLRRQLVARQIAHQRGQRRVGRRVEWRHAERQRLVRGQAGGQQRGRGRGHQEVDQHAAERRRVGAFRLPLCFHLTRQRLIQLAVERRERDSTHDPSDGRQVQLGLGRADEEWAQPLARESQVTAGDRLDHGAAPLPGPDEAHQVLEILWPVRGRRPGEDQPPARVRGQGETR